jgi:hypothetical protein
MIDNYRVKTEPMDGAMRRHFAPGIRREMQEGEMFICVRMPDSLDNCQLR